MDAEQKTFRLMTLQSRLLHREVLRKRALAQAKQISALTAENDAMNVQPVHRVAGRYKSYGNGVCITFSGR